MKKVFAIGLVAVCLAFSGCEEDGDRTVVNDESIIATNGTATVASVDITGDQNTAVVYVESAPGVTQVFSVDVHGNSNFVGIVAMQPQVAPEQEAP